MAVLSDVIRSGYSAGRDIGDDISRVRYQRSEGQIREKYQQLADQEGKSLRDYLPQMEEELRQAGTGMFGADRRGVIGADRQSLSSGATGRLHNDVLRAGEREAGALAMQGNQMGARQERARTLYGLGRFDDGQGQQIAGDTIGATASAVGKDNIYDPAKGALAMSGVSAQYGDQAGAERNATAGNSFRMQSANAIAGNLATMFQNPGNYSPDQIRGTYEGLREKLPDVLAHTDLQVGEDGTWNIYANGNKQATGSFNPKDKTDQAELMDMLQSFTRDPSQVIGSYQQARLKSLEEEKTRRGEIDTDYRKARIDVIKSLTDRAGIPGDLASKIVNGSGSSSSSGSGGGWQLQEIGDDPSTYMIQKNGKVFVVKTNVAADPTSGEAGGPVQVFEADGITPVAATALNAAEKREAVSYVTSIASELAKGDFTLKTEAVKTALEGLRASQAADLGESYTPPSTGGALSRGERNNNHGNIEDRGQFKGQPGYLGSDGRFARFESPEQGQQAHQNQLLRYMQGKTTGQPLTTVADIIGTWSPQSDPGNAAGSTNNYARYVAQRMGVSPDAQLTEGDVARLAQAMGEFETGNTQQGVIGAAPRQQRPAIAAAEPAAPAPAAVPGQRARISPEYVAGAGKELRSQSDDYRSKRDAYEKFVRDNGPGRMSLGGDARTSGAISMGPRTAYDDPTVQRVHDQLKAQMDAAEQKLTAATGELRANTGALNRQTASAADDRRAAELAAKYDPGVADIFARIQ